MIAQIDAARNRHNYAIGDALNALNELAQLTDLPEVGRISRHYCTAIDTVNHAASVGIAGDSGREKKPRLKPLGKESRALGIWPDVDLDYKSESNAFYNAGFEYTGLIGEEAIRAGVVHELSRHGDIRIVGVGAHGDEDGIYLADGLAEPRWWVDVLCERGIDLVVLMACESDSVGDALIKAGFPAVISTQREIEDDQSVAFTRELYGELAKGHTVRASVDFARLVVNRETWEMIRFRQN